MIEEFFKVLKKSFKGKRRDEILEVFANVIAQMVALQRGYEDCKMNQEKYIQSLILIQGENFLGNTLEAEKKQNAMTLSSSLISQCGKVFADETVIKKVLENFEA